MLLQDINSCSKCQIRFLAWPCTALLPQQVIGSPAIEPPIQHLRDLIAAIQPGYCQTNLEGSFCCIKAVMSILNVHPNLFG